MRGIKLAPDDISAEVEGINELVDRVPVLTTIRIHYRIALPEDAPRDKVQRALDTHVAKCPTAQSLKGSVDVQWSVEFA